MSKLTLSVSKVYKNGNNHKHHSAKPHWRRYYYDTDEEKFGAEYVSGIKANDSQTQYLEKKKGILFRMSKHF